MQFGRIERVKISDSHPREHRLQQRALAYWRSVIGDRRYASLAEFDPLFLPDRSSSGFLLDLQKPDSPIVLHVGSELHAQAGLPPGPILWDEVHGDSLLAYLARSSANVLQSEGPVLEEAEFESGEGSVYRLRGILLPLSSNGRRVDHVYGLVSWKQSAGEAG